MGKKAASADAPVVGPSFLVSQVGAHAALEFGAKLESLDLNPRHAGILRMVGRNPGLSQQALSEVLGLFASRLVALLDELEERALVERREHPSDRRSYGLHLTKNGEKSLAKIGALTTELEERMFAALTAAELRTLTSLLERVVAGQSLTPGVHSAYRSSK